MLGGCSLGHFAMQIFGEFFGRLATLGGLVMVIILCRDSHLFSPEKKQKKNMGRSWDRTGFLQLGCAVGDSVIR